MQPKRRKVTINSQKRKIANNEQKWKDWMGLCDEEFEYLISASVPGVCQDVVYDVMVDEDSVKLVRRGLRLDTRNLQKGCHFPL